MAPCTAVSLLVLAGCHVVFGVDPDDSPDAAREFDLEQCPASYSELTPNTRYLLITTPRPWWRQYDDCEDDSDGLTHLAVLESREELDVIYAELEKRSATAWYVGAVQEIFVSTPDQTGCG